MSDLSKFFCLGLEYPGKTGDQSWGENFFGFLALK
jgi:hypothetical protein